MKLQYFSSRGRDETAHLMSMERNETTTDSYNLTCEPLHFHLFRCTLNFRSALNRPRPGTVKVKKTCKLNQEWS